MQKDWIPQELQHVMAYPLVAVTQPVGGLLQFVQRVRCVAAA
jgi:hypothetical protein